ncbi:flagellar hook-length control protein FliK [Hydrogenophaga sp. R2]|uniref:flagellar hook-length control protein FliK n=1 Tax=Hydrogenophaga sp. R2 TaxID=3132827 RepID=UPI003CFA064F
MSQTSAAGGSPASHTTAPAQQAQNGHQGTRPRQGAETGGDLFSSLLSLLASTTLPADDSAAPLADSADAERTDAPQDNPLAGLLATLPGWMPAGMKAATSTAGGAGTDATDRAGPAPTLTPPGKIDGATPLTAEARALLQPLEPGAARERGLEARVERSLNHDKARPAPGAASFAAQAGHMGASGATGQPGRGTEQAPGLSWVRAGGASDTAAQALASSRPTVALDERFAGTPAPSWGAVARREAGADDDLRPGEALGLRSGAVNASAEGSGSIGTAGAGGATTGDGSLGGDAGQGSSASGSDTPRDDSTQQPWAAAADDTEVTHWGAGHVRHASLRVGGEGEDAIDIRLQMQGQEVQVGFATDDAQTRELLREQAPQVLGELLGRSGVELGGVSVGAQGQHGQHAGSGTLAERAAGIERAGRSGRTEAAAGPVLQPLQPKTDGNRPLDVFA